MRKYVLVLAVIGLGIFLSSCGRKKEASLERMQEPLSLEILSSLNTTAAVASGPGVKEIVAPTISLTESRLEPLPPTVNKPTVEGIQKALKNAGFYTGNIDGKRGPLTKKAIEEFQKTNSLEVDGKVGPKTWAVLERYLNSAPDINNKR